MLFMVQSLEQRWMVAQSTMGPKVVFVHVSMIHLGNHIRITNGQHVRGNADDGTYEIISLSSHRRKPQMTEQNQYRISYEARVKEL